DVAVAALPDTMPPQLHFHQLMEIPLLFIAAGPQPAAGIDWQHMPMIVAERGVERQRLDTWFAGRGIKPTVYAQVAGNEAIIAMVSLGCGIGVVPALVLERSPLRDRIAVLDVAPALPSLAVGVCTTRRKLANSVVSAFFRTAEAESK
ncbi:MAG: LysR substrate-binding domain-containing protein, partial [Desulfobacteraceae bacterium]|nr:LysR substrate-binding domain-containing protein [Desulfobacteraceae bacterium]